MKVKELMALLAEIDPEGELYVTHMLKRALDPLYCLVECVDITNNSNELIPGPIWALIANY